MYDTTIATKLIGQLEKFLGRISPHFRKPVARFIGGMMYGIMAEKDVKLSSVVRALKEGITPKKVEDRLSRMLSSNGLERGLHDAIAAEGAGKVHRDTLIILDPSDVQKPYATLVWGHRGRYSVRRARRRFAAKSAIVCRLMSQYLAENISNQAAKHPLTPAARSVYTGDAKSLHCTQLAHKRARRSTCIPIRYYGKLQLVSWLQLFRHAAEGFCYTIRVP